MALFTGENEDEERRELAERWRVLGKKLRSRSPQQFRKVLAIFVASAIDADDEDEKKIDTVYPFH
jgi:hypothetical protein